MAKKIGKIGTNSVDNAQNLGVKKASAGVTLASDFQSGKMNENKEVKRVNFPKRVPMMQLILMIRSISLSLKSGLPISEALEIAYEQVSFPPFKLVIRDIINKANEGMRLSDAMREHSTIFGDLVISVVSVGEQGGSLEQNLFYITDFLKKNHDFNKKVTGALIYPFIVLGLTCLEAIGVIFFVLPKLETLFISFPNVSGFTKVIMIGARFIREQILAILLLILVILSSVALFLKTERGKRFLDILLLNLPVVKKIIISKTVANFARTLTMLLRNSMPLEDSLRICAQTVGSYKYSEVVDNVIEQVSNGKNLATALAEHKKYFPITFIKLIESGERTGSLEENLEFLHQHFSAEVEDMANNMTTLLEPILLVFVTLVLGFLAISIIGPVYQMTGSLN